MDRTGGGDGRPHGDGPLTARQRLAGIVVAHVTIVLVAYLGAMLLCFDLTIPVRYRPLVWQTAPLLVAIRLTLFRRYHLFSGWWHWVGVSDVVDILKSVTMGSLCFATVLGFVNFPVGFPRSVVLLEWLLAVQLLAGARVTSRLARTVLERRGRLGDRRAVLIVASPATASSLLHELDRHEPMYRPVGFVLSGESAARRIHDLPVFGGLDDLERIVSRSPAQEVLIGLPSEDADDVRGAVRACQRARIGFRQISSVRDYLERSGPARSVSLEELFAADESSSPGTASWKGVFRNRSVVLLGAAGGIGSELARAIAGARPDRLGLFDRNESGLYYLQVELAREPSPVAVVPLVGDVLDDARLRHVLATQRPDVVIHAAGDGTAARALEAAVRFHVGRFLLVTTPACIVRATERALVGGSRPDTMACAVRVPYLVGDPSSGVTQIAEALRHGETIRLASRTAPVTVATAGAMVPLVLEAFALADDGEVLSVEPPESRTVDELARYLCRVWNLPETAIRIADAAPPHAHPPDRAEPTAHPRILRRILRGDPLACETVPAAMATSSSATPPSSRGRHA